MEGFGFQYKNSSGRGSLSYEGYSASGMIVSARSARQVGGRGRARKPL